MLTPGTSCSEPVSLAAISRINLNEQKSTALAKLSSQCKEVEASYNQASYNGSKCGKDNDYTSEINLKLKKRFLGKPKIQQIIEKVHIPPNSTQNQNIETFLRRSDRLIDAFVLNQQMREIEYNPYSEILNEEKNAMGYWCHTEEGLDPAQILIWRTNQCSMVSEHEQSSPCKMDPQKFQTCYRRFQYTLDKDQYTKVSVKHFKSGWVTVSLNFYDNS